MSKVFWLRCEKKEFERRAALTPTTSKKLIDAGFDIFVERDEQRIFDDAEYEKYVCYALPSGHPFLIYLLGSGVNSWRTIHGQVLPHRFLLSA